MRVLLACALCIAPCAALAGNAPATAPKSGTYAANLRVETVSDPQNCFDAPGDTYSGVVNYLGIGGTKIAIRLPITLYPNVAFVSTQIFTVTHGAGSLSPSGSYTYAVAGISGQYSTKGTFTASLLEIDAYSFAVEFDEAYTYRGVHCQESFNVALTRTGDAQ